jgi:hypothetical protein
MTPGARSAAVQIIDEMSTESLMPLDEVVWTEFDAISELRFLFRNRCLGSLQVLNCEIESLCGDDRARRGFKLQVWFIMGWHAN